MARLFTAKLIVNEDQKAKIEMLDTSLVSISHVDGLGNVAMFEYIDIECAQNEAELKCLFNILDHAQVIHAKIQNTRN